METELKLPKKWISLKNLKKIIKDLPGEYGIEANKLNNFLISDEEGYVGYIEIRDGEGEYIPFGMRPFTSYLKQQETSPQGHETCPHGYTDWDECPDCCH